MNATDKILDSFPIFIKTLLLPDFSLISFQKKNITPAISNKYFNTTNALFSLSNFALSDPANPKIDKLTL
jgi:hypothetical protein